MGANWQGGSPPQDGDNAFITLDGTYTVTLNVDANLNALSIGGNVGTQTFSMGTSLRTLTLAAASTVGAHGAITFVGHLGGAGDLEIQGTASWAAGTMEGTGTTRVAAGATLTRPSPAQAGNLNRVLENFGTFNWPSGQIRCNDGTFRNRPGGQVNFNNLSAGIGFTAATGTNAFLNEGSISVTGGAQAVIFFVDSGATGTFTNADSGVVDVDVGQLRISWEVSNVSGTTLTGGTWQLSSPLRLENATNIVTNAANLTLDGTAAGIFDQSGADALANFAANAATGILTLAGARTQPTVSLFSNAGQVFLGAGTALNAGGDYVQTGGITELDGATLSATTLVDLQGGSLRGNGTIVGNLRNGGAVSPGLSAGQLNVSGTYEQTATGALNIEVEGPTPGADFDMLVIGGAATLGGALNETTQNVLFPQVGDTFTFLMAASRSGTFAEVNAPCLFQALRYLVEYGPDNAHLRVVSPLLCDLNCDCALDFDDVNPFVLALAGEADYLAEFPLCVWLYADANQDGTVDFDDINAFVDLLGGA